MPAAVVFCLVLGAVAAALRGSPRTVAAVLVATWLLVPGAARVPGTGVGQVFIHRVVIAAVIAGLVWRRHTSRVDRDVFAPRGVHIAFGAFLAVAVVAGVVLAESQTVAKQNFNVMLDLAEQAAFFIAALAVFRACGARRSVEVISVVAGMLAVIAVSEQLFGWSYARWFSSNIVDPTGLLTLPLERRGPHLRVRGAATFALEFSWIVAMLLPVTIAGVLIRRGRQLTRWLAGAVPVLLLLAFVWTWSRSAYAGVAIGVVAVLLGFVLDRPRQIAIVAIGGAIVFAALVQAPLQESVDLSTRSGEQDVRVERLPDILEAVADRPLIGLGLGGLLALGVRVVDISWVNTYATLGIIGVVTLAGLLLTVVHSTSRFLRAGPGEGRLIGAAATGAVVAAVVGFAAYDFGTLRASTETLWALGALGLVANEEMGVLRAPARLRRPPDRVWTLALLGATVGTIALLLTPTRSTVTAVFTTVDPRIAAAVPTDQPFTVKVLSQSACLAVREVGASGSVVCRDRDQLAGGIGEVRVEAPTGAQARQTLDAVEERLTSTFPAATLQVRHRGRGRPTAVRTAPLWAAALGGALGALAPFTPSGGAGSDRSAPVRTSLAPARRRSRMPTPPG